MELLNNIAERLGNDVTVKEVFVENIDNFTLFIPMAGKSKRESAKNIFKKISSKRWQQMCKSISLNYICDTVDIRFSEKEYRLKRFEAIFTCKRLNSKVNLVIEIPWDYIEEQVVKTTTLGKRAHFLVTDHYPQIYFDDIKNDFNLEPCPICYEKFNNLQEICRPNGCKHHFHITCLRSWFKGKRNPTCPYCRVYCTGFNYFLDDREKEKEK